MVEGRTKNFEKTFHANVTKANKFTINKFNFSHINSFRCEFSSNLHKNHPDCIENGSLAIVTSSSDEKFFGYVTRVTKWSDDKKSDLNIVVSDKFCPTNLNNLRIRITPLTNIMNVIDTICNLTHFEKSPLLPLILNPKPKNVNRTVIAPSENFGKLMLDRFQFEAFSYVSSKIEWERDEPHIFLIEGAPGTGKTSLITNMIVHMFRNPDTVRKDYKILLCAPSDTAANVLTEQMDRLRNGLKKEEREIFRVVNFGETIQMIGIDECLEEQLDRDRQEILEEIREIHEKVDRYGLKKELIELLERHKKNLVHMDKLREMERSFKHFDQFNKKTKQKILELANIVICTLTPRPFLLRNLKVDFDIAIIDEATQATEIDCLLALKENVNHLILVGDIQQQPAGIRSTKAKEMGLGKSLFARMASLIPNYTKLRTQYRMNQDVFKFSNKYFYQNQIMNVNKFDSSYKLVPYLVFELESEWNFNTNAENFVFDLVKQVKILIQNETFSIGVLVSCDKQKVQIEMQFR